jgi:hypothetical protein
VRDEYGLQLRHHSRIFTCMDLEIRKNLLIEWLSKLQDARVLQVLESVKALEENDLAAPPRLPEKEEKGLDEAIESMDRGEFLTWTQVRANIREKHGI